MKFVCLLLGIFLFSTTAYADIFDDFDSWVNGDRSNLAEGFRLASLRQQELTSMVGGGASSDEVKSTFREMRTREYSTRGLDSLITDRLEMFATCRGIVTRFDALTFQEDFEFETYRYSILCDNGFFCDAVSWDVRESATYSALNFFSVPLSHGGNGCVLAPTSCVEMTPREAAANNVQPGHIGAYCGDESKEFSSVEDLVEYEQQLNAASAFNVLRAPSTGNLKMVAIPAYYAEDTAPCMPKAEYEAKYAEYKRWFTETSFGKLNIDITVSNPVKLPKTRAQYGQNTGEIHQDAVRLAGATGDLLQVALTSNSAFGWAGLGSVGGGTTWANGYCTSGFFPAIVKHEIGHNLRLLHAGQTSTYDDRYAIMGNQCGGPECHFQLSHKFRLGWTTAMLQVTDDNSRTVEFTSFRNTNNGNTPYGIEFPANGKLVVVEHSDTFGTTTVCVARERTDSISSTTKVLHYMDAGKTYNIGTLTLSCSARTGSGKETRVTFTLTKPGAPQPSPSSSPAPPPPPPSSKPKIISVSSQNGEVTYRYNGVTGATFYYVFLYDYTARNYVPGGYISCTNASPNTVCTSVGPNRVTVGRNYAVTMLGYIASTSSFTPYSDFGTLSA